MTRPWAALVALSACAAAPPAAPPLSPDELFGAPCRAELGRALAHQLETLPPPGPGPSELLDPRWPEVVGGGPPSPNARILSLDPAGARLDGLPVGPELRARLEGLARHDAARPVRLEASAEADAGEVLALLRALPPGTIELSVQRRAEVADADRLRWETRSALGLGRLRALPELAATLRGTPGAVAEFAPLRGLIDDCAITLEELEPAVRAIFAAAEAPRAAAVSLAVVDGPAAHAVEVAERPTEGERGDVLAAGAVELTPADGLRYQRLAEVLARLAQAGHPLAAPALAPDEPLARAFLGALPSLPAGLTAATAGPTIAHLERELGACAASASGAFDLRLDLEPSGAIGSASARGPSAALGCLEAAAKRVRFLPSAGGALAISGVLVGP